MADRRDKLNKTLIMIGIVSAVVVIIIAKIFQMKNTMRTLKRLPPAVMLLTESYRTKMLIILTKLTT